MVQGKRHSADQARSRKGTQFPKILGKVGPGKRRRHSRIASPFFKKIAELEPVDSDCFLFDTTNYYTYMASDTESELAQRGKNKEGKDWLRQIGVALMVSRVGRIPLFFREYEGNRHDSKEFNKILAEMTTRMKEPPEMIGS